MKFRLLFCSGYCAIVAVLALIFNFYVRYASNQISIQGGSISSGNHNLHEYTVAEKVVEDRQLSTGSTGSDSENSSETAHSLFGSVDALNATIGTIAILIIIGAVQLVEYLFHGLHALTHDTPFQQMVSTIEKELMIVGCTAFIFKITINAKHFLTADWFYALEYAGNVDTSHAPFLTSHGSLLVLQTWWCPFFHFRTAASD